MGQVQMLDCLRSRILPSTDAAHNSTPVYGEDYEWVARLLCLDPAGSRQSGPAKGAPSEQDRKCRPKLPLVPYLFRLGIDASTSQPAKPFLACCVTGRLLSFS